MKKLSSPLAQQRFVCIDCEATGLNPKADRVVEVAVAVFSFTGIELEFESLVNPQSPIPAESTAIHNITDAMVATAPTMPELLPKILPLISDLPIIGHNIQYDIDIIIAEAERAGIPHTLKQNPSIDTLRLARLYGNSPSNSLEVLRQHFNIPAEGAHRAMSDVVVNIQVFKHLVASYNRLNDVYNALSRPILMKQMPLGKHKGRPFKEIPLQYLMWAIHQEFDQDLMHSLRTEISRRRKGNTFCDASSPFSGL